MDGLGIAINERALDLEMKLSLVIQVTLLDLTE